MFADNVQSMHATVGVDLVLYVALLWDLCNYVCMHQTDMRFEDENPPAEQTQTFVAANVVVVVVVWVLGYTYMTERVSHMEWQSKSSSPRTFYAAECGDIVHRILKSTYMVDWCLISSLREALNP